MKNKYNSTNFLKKCLLSFLLFSFFGNTKATTTDTATIVGHALSEVAISLNELPYSDFCLLKSTLNNNNLSEQQKLAILYSDFEVKNFMDTLMNCMATLNNYNAHNYAESLEKRAAIINVVGHDFDSRPNGGPCAAYNAQRWNCNADYTACGLAAYYLCISTAVYYPLCAGAWALVCTTQMVTCHYANAALYPNCAGGQGVHVDWHDWLDNQSPSSNCQE
jgi:hypothetical protein